MGMERINQFKDEYIRKMFIINQHNFASGPLQKFIVAAGITDTTQRAAVTYLYNELVSEGLITKFVALYPIIGGTADSHKYNLIDSDLFPISFNANVVHSANGITSTSSRYSDIPVNPSLHLSKYDVHMAFYNRLNGTNGYLLDLAAQISGGGTGWMRVRDSAGLFAAGYWDAGGGLMSIANSDSRGFFNHNAIAQTNQTLWRNGSKLKTDDCSTNNPPNKEFTLSTNTYRQYALISLGLGLADAENLTYYNIVQVYQTMLSRQV